MLSASKLSKVLSDQLLKSNKPTSEIPYEGILSEKDSNIGPVSGKSHSYEINP